MTQQPHEIVVTVTPQGKVQGEVKGVPGKSCAPLSAWLDELGKVESDSATSDFYKPDQQGITRTTGR